MLDENTIFKSLRRGDITFNEVFGDVLHFVEADTSSSYRISIGSDSQVGKTTLFVTCIHVHRIGKGAIGFLHKSHLARPIKNLREKIYMETCVTLQLAYMFEQEKIDLIRDVLARSGRGVTFEFHIDIGEKGKTKALINEMVGMVKGLNFTPKIKPDSYCASTFADRYTKAI